MIFAKKSLMKLPLQNERLPVKNLLSYGLLPAFLKKLIYKIKGFKIGSNVKIGFGSIIVAKEVEISDNVNIGYFTVLSAKKIKIGAYSSIASFCFINTEYFKVGEDTRIREQVYAGGLKTPESELIIGDRCLVGHMTSFNPTMPIIVGDDSSIGGHSFLFTHSSWLSKLEGFPVKFGPIKIGNHVWGSWCLFINAGVEIGDYVILKPNSVVSKNIPPNSIFSSNPDRIIPNIFHTPKSNNEMKQIIQQILQSFVEYLNYNEINANVKNGFVVCVIANKHYKIIIQEEEDIKLSSQDINILITFLKFNKLSDKIGVNDMILSLEEKTRYGSNLLGEELIKFFSRYGIRFKRN